MPSSMQYTLVGTEDGSKNLTVFVPGGRPLVAHSSHVNFDAILEGVLAGDESVLDLFDAAATAATKFERLSDRITSANGRLYLDGEEVDNSLTQQVVRFIGEGMDDWKPLVRFFENVQMNPNAHSRENLYRWLSDRDFTITEEGLIVGYKGVRPGQSDGEFFSINSGRAIVDGEVHTGSIPNKTGSIVEMPRSEVAFDPGVGCSTGLHVGTYEYANGFARGALLEVHVHPRDVVSVPTDSGDAKMRVCRYRVVDTIDAPYTVAVVRDYFEDDEDDFDFWGERDFEDDDPWGSDMEVPEAPGAMNGEEEDSMTVRVGDEFEDADSRRKGRRLVVEGINGDEVTILSIPTNRRLKVRLDRLTSRKYQKVK